jgi:dihydropteroate synthase
MDVRSDKDTSKHLILVWFMVPRSATAAASKYGGRRNHHIRWRRAERAKDLSHNVFRVNPSPRIVLFALGFLSTTVMPFAQTSIDLVAGWAGLSLDRPRVMGILNVTPDSFSDGGRRLEVRAAIEAGLAMAADGADIIDVGGESTRPGAEPVVPGLEQDRVVPVITALAAAGHCVSVDTRNAATMQAALAAGARIVNDVTALAYDPLAALVVADSGCPVVLMHMRGSFATMYAEARYGDVAAAIRDELGDRIEAAIRAGVRPAQIAVDPGIGFAKQAAHSIAALRGLSELTRLGYPVVVGASRKSFIGAVTQEPDARRRLGGSLAAALFAVSRGASILRVHDVRDTVQALSMWQTLFE